MSTVNTMQDTFVFIMISFQWWATLGQRMFGRKTEYYLSSAKANWESW